MPDILSPEEIDALLKATELEAEEEFEIMKTEGLSYLERKMRYHYNELKKHLEEYKIQKIADYWLEQELKDFKR